MTPPPSSQRELDPFQAIGPSPEVEELRAEVASLRRLQEAIHFLGGARDLAALRAELLDVALSVTGLRRGLFALARKADDGPRRLKLKETRGFSARSKGSEEVKVLRRMLEDAAARREPLLEGCLRAGGLLEHAARAPRLGAVAALPLEVDGELLGGLLLDDPQRDRPFTTAETSLLRSFARHVALALHRLALDRRARKRAAALERRADRLEGELAALGRREHKVRAATERLRAASQRLEAQAARASVDPLQRLCDEPYADAKRSFTRAYLARVMRDAGGDLRGAARLSGLPVARLVGLLDTLGLRESDWAQRAPAADGG